MRYKVQTTWTIRVLLEKLGIKSNILVNHRDHPCTFGKSWGLNSLQSANHRDHPCTFGKPGTKSKFFGKPQGHPCTLLENLSM
ncbi:hypothetical protein HanIR_Chr03g0144761 [Helianthus annuus]|nr:hypothetical protein HanIR_Chr03g0144761 [Helianthus annuus]